jgi:hypothetical protein
MVAEWVLILLVASGTRTSLTSAEFVTQDRCIAAGESAKKQLTAHIYGFVSYVCAKR